MAEGGKAERQDTGDRTLSLLCSFGYLMGQGTADVKRTSPGVDRAVKHE